MEAIRTFNNSEETRGFKREIQQWSDEKLIERVRYVLMMDNKHPIFICLEAAILNEEMEMRGIYDYEWKITDS